MTDLEDLLAREEPLHEDLQPWVVKAGHMWLVNHPLVQEFVYDDKRCALINARYAIKQKYVEEARQKKDWERFVWLHERPYRLQAFLAIKEQVAGNLPKLVASIWIDSENIWQNQKDWLCIWSTLPEPHKVMDEGEQVKFNLLPDEVLIFRGIRGQRLNKRGLSWTLNREKAEWFANRYKDKKQKPILLCGRIRKDVVYALFTGRGEDEIVAPPAKVKILEEVSLGL